jgi:hypothetical protein
VASLWHEQSTHFCFGDVAEVIEYYPYQASLSLPGHRFVPKTSHSQQQAQPSSKDIRNMCFLEYIAYTCGHCSALRQFPSPGMCPVCERIIHSRSVISLEWEHRFMHERGLCGCEVIFPGLTGPHNAGALNGVAEEEYQRRLQENHNPGDLTVGNIARAPPIFEVLGQPGVDMRINVRVPSLYSVEWLDDHRQLRKSANDKPFVLKRAPEQES